MPWYVNLTQIVNTLVFSIFVYFTVVQDLFLGVSATRQIDEAKKTSLEKNPKFNKSRIMEDPKKGKGFYLLKIPPYTQITFGVCILLYLFLDFIWSVVSLNQSWATTLIFIQAGVFLVAAVYYAVLTTISKNEWKIKLQNIVTVVAIVILYAMMTVVVVNFIKPSVVSPIVNQVDQVLPK